MWVLVSPRFLLLLAVPSFISVNCEQIDPESGSLRALQQSNIVSQLRFSRKITFDTSVQQQFRNDIESYFPLTAENFPLSQDLCDVLIESNCASVLMPDDFEVRIDIPTVIEIAGGEPPHAPEPEFWPWFEEITDYQILRRLRGNVLISSERGMPWFPLPQLWENYTITDVAESVHNKYLGYQQYRMIAALVKEGIALDDDIIPSTCKVDFLHGIIMYAHLNTWTIDTVGSTNFATKYYVGRARPEEVAISVHCSIDGNDVNPECLNTPLLPSVSIPASIKQKIRRMNLTSMESYTAYPEGSPMHPAWPAMHSAGSILSIWLPVVADLTSRQLEEVKKLDLAVAMARTVAGVHYTDDNLAGLVIGQAIIEQELPGYLEKRYGADAEKVKDKLAKNRFDWKETASRLTNEYISVA